MDTRNSSELAIETLSAVVQLLRKYETRFANQKDFQSSTSCKDHVKRCEVALLALQSGKTNQEDLRKLYQTCESADEVRHLLGREIGPLEAVVGSDSKNLNRVVDSLRVLDFPKTLTNAVLGKNQSKSAESKAAWSDFLNHALEAASWYDTRA